MAEFHKKEIEELAKEHDKMFELLDEDRKKVQIQSGFIYFHVNVGLAPFLEFYSQAYPI